MGFGTHPHDNIEIITIPLVGDLAHKDSLENTATIKGGDIQVISAGIGVKHSEFNSNADQRTKLLQIWVYPNQQNVEPRYQQITLNSEDRKNILSPNDDDDDDDDDDDAGVWIDQDAWFYLGKFEKGIATTYNLKKEGNGVYAFIPSGNVNIKGQELENRDEFGIWDTNSLDIKATFGAEFLWMEIPMQH